MDARCVNCNDKATYELDKNKIICDKCNMEIDYDEYIEMMKEKALTLADNFQTNWDRRGF